MIVNRTSHSRLAVVTQAAREKLDIEAAYQRLLQSEMRVARLAVDSQLLSQKVQTAIYLHVRRYARR